MFPPDREKKMIVAQTERETQVLWQPDVDRKLAFLHETVERVLCGSVFEVPNLPGRDVQILALRELPDKPGLSSRKGQARLLHDLASIELQAMELAVRTLIEFPEAPREFREQLALIAKDEGRHLGLCLRGLENLDSPWGSFPTHLALWQCVDREDSLLDRILIVHRYLEGSGLDASDQILRRLSSVSAPEAREVLSVIAREEVGHVEFGSRWYREFCRLNGVEAGDDFGPRLLHLSSRIPRRLEKINVELRRRAGFTDEEILALREFQGSHHQKARPAAEAARLHTSGSPRSS